MSVPLIKERSLTTGVALALWIIGNEKHIKIILDLSHKIFIKLNKYQPTIIGT